MKVFICILFSMLAVPASGTRLPDMIDPQTSDSKSGFKECLEANTCLNESLIHECSIRHGASETMRLIMEREAKTYHEECPAMRKGWCLDKAIQACLKLREKGSGKGLCNEWGNMNEQAKSCLQTVKNTCNTNEANKAIDNALDICDDEKQKQQLYEPIMNEIKCLVPLDPLCPNHTEGVLCMERAGVNPRDVMQYTYLESRYQTICPALGSETCLDKELFECDKLVETVCDENGELNSTVKTCYEDLNKTCNTLEATKEIGLFLERCHNTTLWSNCLKTNAAKCIRMLHQGPHVVCYKKKLINDVKECFENVKKSCPEDQELIDGIESSVCDHRASSIRAQVECFVAMKSLTVENFDNALKCMRKSGVTREEIETLELIKNRFGDEVNSKTNPV